MTFTFGSLFAGIGGLDLGLERSGMTCKWQVEIDDYARRVLSKHWPDVYRHDDVRTFCTGYWQRSRFEVDLICGGFPCQDISNAGHRAGIDGKRSGLWSEFARIIGVLRPRYVFVENVAALLHRGLGRVLGDLAAFGFDAEWHCIPAGAVGAPHIRDRVFILAHTNINGRTSRSRVTSGKAKARPAHRRNTKRLCSQISNAHGQRLQVRQMFAADDAEELKNIAGHGGYRRQWATEPNVDRVANGIPSRVDRLRGLGNAVVPQVAEFIGRKIMENA